MLAGRAAGTAAFETISDPRPVLAAGAVVALLLRCYGVHVAQNLTDQCIVITGASSGIGAATAIECAKAGMNVVINARRKDRLEEVAAKVRGLGRRAELVVGDVREEGITRRMLDCAQDSFGGFHAVFANAGYGMSLPCHEMTVEQMREMFEVNFLPCVDLLNEAARRLLAGKRRGHLLMCSSCLSKFSIPRHGAYAATKAAQNRICTAMRMELKRYGIYVSSVHPITTTTEFFEVSARLSGKGNEKHANIPRHSPRLFVQPPERVARAIVRCLRKPCPEVWTSLIVRFASGIFTVFPRFGDRAILAQAKRD
ncbi:MAG: SDR family oxidoreductase [Phycisphaerales bacterium]|nr:MAG: SDR family oxidoreductase [Phycisphaerales bacterium]